MVNPLSAAEFSLAPGMMELETLPGGVKSFVLSVQNNGREKAFFRLYTTDMVISKKGEVDFSKPGSSKWSCAKWITLYPAKITLEPGKSADIKCDVRVPRGEVGGRYAVVMCEEDSGEIEMAENTAFVSSNWRIGCAVLLTIKGYGVEKKAEIMEIRTKPESDGWHFSVFLENKGNIHIKGEGEVVLRDQNERFLSKVKLTTLKGDTIFPEGVCRYRGELKRSLPEGTYTLQARINYGGVKPAIGQNSFYSKGIISNLETANKGVKDIGFCVIEPAKLEMDILPGRFFSKVITLKNTREESIDVKIKVKDFEVTSSGEIKYLTPGESHCSAAGWLEVSPLEFTIPANEEKRIKLALNVPRGVEGGQYAMLTLESSTAEGLRSSSDFPLLLSIKDTLKKEIKIDRFEITPSQKEDGTELKCSIKIKNSGNVHLYPKLHLLVHGEDKQEPDDVPIGKEREMLLLPNGELESSFILSPHKGEKSGTYDAELVVEYGQEEKVTSKKWFEIKEGKKDDDKSDK